VGAINISIVDFVLFYLLLLIPLAVSLWLDLGIIKDSVFALLRMTAQLLFIGFYLNFIFNLNSLFLNILWILAMLIMANASAIRQSGLSFWRIIPFTFSGTAIGFTVILAIFVGLIIRPTPVYDARYLIPIAGMLLGNCMRGNVIALERFYTGIRSNEKEFITYQMLGANLREATRPYLQTALRAAIKPHIASMSTLGIVSLPGMMTGQILGGATPMTAIKYQIAIMIGIFCVMLTASALSIVFSLRTAFDSYGMLRQDIFYDEKTKQLKNN
jgi:putative ABC transport system permease protein